MVGVLQFITAYLQKWQKFCRQAHAHIYNILSTILAWLSTINCMFVDELKGVSTTACLQYFDAHLQNITQFVDTQFNVSTYVYLQYQSVYLQYLYTFVDELSCISTTTCLQHSMRIYKTSVIL